MMPKQVKALVIAAAVLLVLGAVLAVLILTEPKPEPAAGSVENSSQTGVNAYIIDRKADEVTKVVVSGGEGAFTFTRQTLFTDSGSEYFWTSAELKGVPRDDGTVRNFITNLAGLPAKSVVEEHAEDFEKYGLDTPKASAELAFEDGTAVKMLFGIQNPVDESSVYFRTADSDTVYLVNYYAVAGVFSDVRRFAALKLTGSYDSGLKNEFEALKITRPDLEEPIEIVRLEERAGSDEGETFNTHRFASPITAEVDVTKGRTIISGVYGLTMNACEFIEQTPENLEKCGFNDPAATVEFTVGGKEYELTIGGKTEGGYYAVMSGTAGIWSLAEEKAPWVTCEVGDVVSSRPLSPYIYSVESVEVTVPEGTFVFDIDGENKSFSCGGTALGSDEFRSFYQTLITAVGEELFTGETDGEPTASVTFRYKSGGSDTLSYYDGGDRKCIVALNGTALYKVRRVYVDMLAGNVEALLNGGSVRTEF